MSSYSQSQIGHGCSSYSQRGFTLVEMIVVIILLGILSAVAIPRLSGTSDYQAYSLRSSILSSLRLAQKTALAQHDSSVYWVLQRPADDLWQIQVMLLDDELLDVTPATASGAFAASSTVGYSVSQVSSTLSSASIGVGQNVVVLYNQLGDMIEVKDNISLSASSAYPSADDATDVVISSLNFSDSKGSFCLSLTGYSYEATCR
ncbi:type II secretion system protein [Neptuniibacter sp.]|uniref:type II secretion system protein n=1 Tax=Neptuniibacter sp. TaxID=1962643 RepID=UPI002635D4EF|nr:type II secretion system protein [Neptuniibacter sp.]MCP4597305.1 type II secretion system protein [Neptuniibacter sp.]